MKKGLEELVRTRAGNRCEYCQLAQQYFREKFQVDHIIARQHTGPSVSENLALSCLRCNRHKGPNIACVDPITGSTCMLFNPRTDRWGEHFEWRGPMVAGLTPVGRATIHTLNMNAPSRIAVRESLIAEGVFPSSAL